MKQRYENTTTAGRSVRLAGAALAVGVLLAGNGAAWAQQPATPAPAAAPVPAAAPAPTVAAVINAKAVDRLNAMGAHLRSLKTFTVNADVTVEEVLDSPAHGAPRELAITPLLGPKGGNPGNISYAHGTRDCWGFERIPTAR